MTFGFVYFILALFPLAFIIAFSFLEFAIAFIQSIVFVILASTYTKDGLDLHSEPSKSTVLNAKHSYKNKFYDNKIVRNKSKQSTKLFYSTFANAKDKINKDNNQLDP